MIKATVIEPALILYVFSSFVKFSVFQALLHEKTCFLIYKDFKYCSNISLVHDDIQIQTDANHLFVFSSLCLLLPSILISLWLGSLCDNWSAKIPIIIPLIGLVIGDINYIIQTVWFEFHPYLLLISDLVFGFTGGFSGLIGMMFAYRMKQKVNTQAGSRIAILEGSMGIGTSLGYAISGILRKLLGFPGTFTFLLILRLIILFYVVVFLKEIRPDVDLIINEDRSYLKPLHVIKERLVGAFRVVYENRSSRSILILSLIALSFSLFSSSGINNILFSFFRFKLEWDDRQYGWYNGLRYTFSTLAVLTIYPLMQRRGVSDMKLCFIALIIKMINIIGIGFVFSTYFAFILTVFTTTDRFIPTALRASASQSVDLYEQGRVLSVMGVIQGITSLTGSLLFNTIYPLSLPSYTFTCFIAVVLLLIVPLIISVYVEKQNMKQRQQLFAVSQSSSS